MAGWQTAFAPTAVRSHAGVRLTRCCSVRKVVRGNRFADDVPIDRTGESRPDRKRPSSDPSPAKPEPRVLRSAVEREFPPDLKTQASAKKRETKERPRTRCFN